MNDARFSHSQRKTNFKFRFFKTSLLLLTAIVCMCTKPPKQEILFEQPSPPVSIVLVPGDVVDVKFYYTPEINESQTVRPDGKISLQLLGDVQVAGKTTEELRQELIQTYSKHLKDPEVTVILRSMHERRVYVSGEVNRPGLISLPGSLSVLEAIMDAGGFNMASAKPQNVIVIRYKKDRWVGTSVDLSKALKGQEVSLMQLEPRDIIFVPRTTIACVDQWVEQYVNKVIPSIVTALAGSSIFWYLK